MLVADLCIVNFLQGGYYIEAVESVCAPGGKQALPRTMSAACLSPITSMSLKVFMKRLPQRTRFVSVPIPVSGMKLNEENGITPGASAQ